MKETKSGFAPFVAVVRATEELVLAHLLTVKLEDPRLQRALVRAQDALGHPAVKRTLKRK